MNNTNNRIDGGNVFAFFLAGLLSFLAGVAFQDSASRKKFEREAVKAGRAEWVVNDDGIPLFSWKK